MTLERLLDVSGDHVRPASLYRKLKLPEPPAHRPYLFVNMVATVDGKIVLGGPGGPAKGLGGPIDQELFRRLQANCDAALIGSNTLRASQVIYPPKIMRFAVTRSGDIPLDNRFFTDAPSRAYVLAPGSIAKDAKRGLLKETNLILVGGTDVDFTSAMRILRERHEVRYLLCEGGSNINGQLFRAGLVDELFLTIAPKLKGGTDLPTIVGGPTFPPGKFEELSLVSIYHDENEIYLRYRVG